MPITPRPPKAGGTVQYQTEVQAGFLDIIDAEVDGDIDPLYNLVNGRLDNANIANAAGIVYTKLNLAGSIRGSDMAPIGPNNAGIAGGNLVADSITTRELAPNAVLLENIGPSQATAFQAQNGDDADFTLTAAELLMAEQQWTTRGGHWFAVATVGGLMTATTQTIEATIRLREGGTAGLPTDGTIYQASRVTSNFSGVGVAGTVPWSATLIAQGSFLLSGPPIPNPQRMKLTAQITTGPGNANVIAHWKRILLVEMA